MAQQLKKILATFPLSQQCFSKIEELNALYKKMYNKNSKTELYFSRSGTDVRPIYDLVIYYSNEDQDELKFFENKINEQI